MSDAEKSAKIKALINRDEAIASGMEF